jgi:hypothetical protein
MAFNASGAVARKRALKEAQIERMVESELEERKQTWDINKGQFDRFQQWYVNYRRNLWHR